MIGVLFGANIVVGVINIILFVMTGNPLNAVAAIACGASSGYLWSKIYG